MPLTTSSNRGKIGKRFVMFSLRSAHEKEQVKSGERYYIATV
jgi:hypothetical protein